MITFHWRCVVVESWEISHYFNVNDKKNTIMVSLLLRSREAKSVHVSKKHHKPHIPLAPFKISGVSAFRLLCLLFLFTLSHHFTSCFVTSPLTKFSSAAVVSALLKSEMNTYLKQLSAHWYFLHLWNHIFHLWDALCNLGSELHQHWTAIVTYSSMCSSYLWRSALIWRVPCLFNSQKQSRLFCRRREMEDWQTVTDRRSR